MIVQSINESEVEAGRFIQSGNGFVYRVLFVVGDHVHLKRIPGAGEHPFRITLSMQQIVTGAWHAWHGPHPEEPRDAD